MSTEDNNNNNNNNDNYLLIDIERAKITRNHQPLGMGKMDPFVVLTINSSGSMNTSQKQQQASARQITRTPTHWDSHFNPVWFHACPTIEGDDPSSILTFQVYNDSSLGRVNWKVIGVKKITIEELMTRAANVKAQSLGLAAKVVLELDNNEGTLTLSVRARSHSAISLLSTADGDSDVVDPTWFEHPVQRLGVSGGTAPFFALKLTPKGLEEVAKTESSNPKEFVPIASPSYYIGKDLSHAEDEKDFYTEIKHIAEYDLEQEGVGLLIPFMFDYLGVLTTKTADTSEECELLVMQNLRDRYSTFRMLDLKMGQQTAQANWQGKSRFRAMKQNVLDGMTNSTVEGYRLEGFDGNPQRIDSMDPFMDLLASSTGNDVDNECGSSKTLLWGKQVSDKDIKKARRIMFQTFTGADIFRYFLDMHLDKHPNENPHEALFSVEVAEIVLHELVSRLVHLALTCHKLEIPQKWIGSSVALGYDAGLFPHRSSSSSNDEPDDAQTAEAAIRSKVIVNVFDWGRSELLTMKRYGGMTDMEKQDRQQFWENYKNGMDRLAYNATREYYHRFTRCLRTTTDWTLLTLQVMDFDSMSADDYMGKVDITLPSPVDYGALLKLQERQEYQLEGINGVPQGSIVCSISWLEFPSNSRLAGTWRVMVERASNLPIKDVNTQSSDPYVIVSARDGCNHRNLQQMTCVKARNLNPIWNETIDVPVMKSDHLRQAMSAKEGSMLFDDSFPPEDRELARIFEFRDRPGQDDITYWTECLKKAASLSMSYCR